MGWPPKEPAFSHETYSQIEAALRAGEVVFLPEVTSNVVLSRLRVWGINRGWAGRYHVLKDDQQNGAFLYLDPKPVTA